ncbi:DUF4468 domain-containing protein [Marinagarivorans cellulosilyticus]|nr:DUF4468 domain-containing protein [Marinagarivorans cellulosilyticus]
MVTTESVPSERVVEVDGAEKDTLYVRANNWMVDAFNNADSVVQFTDKESGTISGRYLLGTVSNASEYGPARRAYATIKVRVKDGASKITVTPESFTYAKGNIYTLYTEEDAKRDVDALLFSFETAMKKSEDDEW